MKIHIDLLKNLWITVTTKWFEVEFVQTLHLDISNRCLEKGPSQVRFKPLSAKFARNNQFPEQTIVIKVITLTYTPNKQFRSVFSHSITVLKR